jgi:hypothetical protein
LLIVIHVLNGSFGIEEALGSGPGPPIDTHQRVYTSSIESAGPMSIGSLSGLQDLTLVPNTESHVDSESPRSQRVIECHSASITSPGSRDREIAGQSASINREVIGHDPVPHGHLETPSMSPGLTQREAFLFRTWVQKIALIVSIRYEGAAESRPSRGY